MPRRDRRASRDGQADRRASAHHRHGGGTAPGPEDLVRLPSYARDGKVIAFFQPASKFDTRYSTVGFNEDAQLDDGVFWPTAYAVLKVTAEVENALRALVRTASR